MTNELTRDDYKRLEYELKKDAVRRFVWLQRERMFSVESFNVGNVNDYHDTVRTLRRLLRSAPCEQYQPIRELFARVDKLPDRYDDILDVSKTPKLYELLDEMEKKAFVPPEHRRNFATHDGVA